MEQYIIIGLLAVVIVLLVSVRSKKAETDYEPLLEQMEKTRRDMAEEARATRQESLQNNQASMKLLGELLTENQKTTTAMQDTRLGELNSQLNEKQRMLQQTVNEQLQGMDLRMRAFAQENQEKLEAIRATVEKSLTDLREENGKKLEEMRATVDEKLQKTLEERIGQSFKLVSERLEQVYRGLGEMQTLANGVGDLKKVLSNVKTRGILGEIQLGAILEEILAPEQYEVNVVTKPNSKQPVEYAVKLPGDGENLVYLPIDSKFPGDTYAKLVDAYEAGNPAEIAQAAAALDRAIKSFAKDIHDKYIDPPHTTDFGIMFLPFEGLYAEVVRRGMVEILQRDYKINIAGPTTMAALLNSLQMGFRTLAIQKRSGEVWQVLGAVKVEFDKFAGVLAATQQRLEQANSELDKLVGVRTRQIQKKLRSVTVLPEEECSAVLGLMDNGNSCDAESEEEII